MMIGLWFGETKITRSTLPLLKKSWICGVVKNQVAGALERVPKPKPRSGTKRAAWEPEAFSS